MADKKFYTWKQIEHMSLYLAQVVENQFFTHILGLSRGGCVPATIISHKLNIPMIPITLSTRDHPDQLIPNFPIGHGDGDNYIDQYKFLVVDDINDTGETFQRMQSIMLHRGAHYVEYAVLINNEPSKFSVNYFAEQINKEKDPRWIVYPWEV